MDGPSNLLPEGGGSFNRCMRLQVTEHGGLLATNLAGRFAGMFDRSGDQRAGRNAAGDGDVHRIERPAQSSRGKPIGTGHENRRLAPIISVSNTDDPSRKE